MKRFLLALCLAHTCLNAACNLGLDVNSVSWPGDGGVGYEVFSSVEYVETVDFYVTHDAGDSCSFFVTFSEGNSGSYSRKVYNGVECFDYQIYDSFTKNQVLKELPEAVSSSDVLEGTISISDVSPRLLRYYITIPIGQVVLAGTYTDVFTMRVHEGTIGSSTEIASADVTLTVSVPSIMQMSSVDIGAPFDEFDTLQALDFEELVESEVSSFDLVVRSNAGYLVNMQSTNSSEMHHQSLASTITYTLDFDATTKDLSSGSSVQVTSSSGSTTASGTSHQIDVTIGSVDAKISGTYTDVITITASTNE
jgi:spore coat protein U-like protein